MSDAHLPPALRRRSSDESVWEDIAWARNATAAERSLVLERLCRMAAELAAQHPHPRRTLGENDPLSQESERLLTRLRALPRRLDRPA